MNIISAKETLKREIGVRSLTLAIINQIIGTGIFVIPAIVSEILGASAIMAYLVCGALVFLIALCFAELGSKTTASGGVYEYIETAFGPFTGFLSNNIYWFGASVLSDGAIANGLADTLTYFIPALRVESFRIVFFLVIFGGLALLNARSVKNGVGFVQLTAFGKVVPLLILVCVGVFFVSKENLAWTIFPTVSSLSSVSLLLFFAFMGFETPLSNGGEIKNVKRTVPLGVILGVGGVLIIYLGIQLVTQGVLGNTISLHKDAPLAAVAGIVFGKFGIVLIIIVTAISMLGALGGEILSVPRILFAGARDGLLPNALAKVHPKFSTPYVAILVYAGLGFLISVFGGFKQLAVLSSAAALLIYLGAVLATIKLRKTNSNKTEKTFLVPGGFVIPILASLVILWLLSSLSKQELTGIAIFIAILSLLYFIIKFFKKKSLN